MVRIERQTNLGINQRTDAHFELDAIHCVDCLEGLKSLENESIDCVVTDPPYGISYLSNWYKAGNPHKSITNDDRLFLPLDELWRVLKPTGAIFAFYSHKIPLIDKRVKNVIIWVKNNWSAGDLHGDFGNQYECIAFLPKPGFKLFGKRLTNVWHVDRVPAHKLQHPTQKPEALIARILDTATKQGDLVLDPFMGSGTTAVACVRAGRRFIGFETEQAHVEVAKNRVNLAKQQSSIRL